MKIYRDESLRNFEFWCGACDVVRYLTDEDLDKIEIILEECRPEGMTDTEINDLFWFEEDIIAEWLGYSSFDEIIDKEDR